MPSIIQFIHPGWEHGFGKDDKYPVKNWNKGSHKRKFVKQKGQIEENEDLKNEELLFWCEWEPASKVEKKLITDFNEIPQQEIFNYSDFPKYLYDELFFENLDRRLWRQNTDPCIFGNQFYFGLCQQSRKKKKSEERSPTFMTKLERGSIILFGSHKQNKKTREKLFLLDTVFVVSDWIEYKGKEDILYSNEPRINKEFHEIFTRFVDSQDFQRRLYFGATYENSVNGMYSFVPAKVNNNAKFGFERPHVKLENIINPKKNTGFKISNRSIDDCKEIWDKIAMQIDNLNLKKGINFEMPKKKIVRDN